MFHGNPDILDRLRAALADRYRVEREVGRGGMALVLLAQDLKLRREVAIKVLQPEIALDVGAGRFLKEIGVSAGLNHPHILPLLDSGEADGLVYYVMPYVAGGTLRERLSREGQLSIETAVGITTDIAGALTYAHSRGVLHRDVKPENILLGPGHAIITDFGIARAIEAAAGETLTATGATVGTPAYMSPEQALGERDLDQRSDLYSLACVTYEMLVGEPPFTGPTAQVILGRRLNERPRSVRATRDAVAPPVDAAVARALSANRADRFATVEQFASALHSPAVAAAIPAAEAANHQTSGSGRPWRRRSALAALLAVAVVMLVVGVWRQQRVTVQEPAGGEPPRLAVLPLENLGGPDDEPFAAGISEEIMSRLAEIGGLRVVSRTSAKRFTDRQTSIPEMGHALNADFVLEGTVRTDRSQGPVGMVRVTTKLIRVADDVQVWQDRFDASLVPGEIFGVQADIASRVAGALNLSLGEPERQRIARVATLDSSAYRLHQLGRFQWEKRDASSLLRAQRYFEEAIARDAGYADAHAGLADATNAYVILFGTESGRSAGAPAIAAARRAIALDSTLAAAHAALGFALMFFDWNWAEAEAALTRAIALDLAYAPARYWYAQLLWLRNRPSDALEHARQAIAVDPLSAVAHLAHARTLRLLGRTEEWVTSLERVTELQPNLWVPYADLAEYHAAKGDPAAAAVAVRQFLAAVDPARRVSDETVRALVRVVGGAGEAAEVVRRLQEEGIVAQPGLIARWFAMTGQSDSAFARMHHAVDAHSPDVATTLPFLQSTLGEDARWPVLRERVGLRP